MSIVTSERATSYVEPAEQLDILQAQDRQLVETRIEEILTMPEKEIAHRLMALVGLVNVASETPSILITSIEDAAEHVLDEVEDEDYRIGEVAALIDAAHITGNSALAETALKIVEDDTEFKKFPFDTHAAATISVEQEVGYREAIIIAQEMREKTDMPLTPDEVKKYGYLTFNQGPLGSEYDWLFDSTIEPK